MQPYSFGSRSIAFVADNYLTIASTLPTSQYPLVVYKNNCRSKLKGGMLLQRVDSAGTENEFNIFDLASRRRVSIYAENVKFFLTLRLFIARSTIDEEISLTASSANVSACKFRKISFSVNGTFCFIVHAFRRLPTRNSYHIESTHLDLTEQKGLDETRKKREQAAYPVK